MLCVRFLSLQVCGGSDGTGACELRVAGEMEHIRSLCPQNF